MPGYLKSVAIICGAALGVGLATVGVVVGAVACAVVLPIGIWFTAGSARVGLEVVLAERKARQRS